MKKSLFLLGVAVAALTSCTNNEVMEVAENRAIGFSSFVGNTTKAATEFTGAATSADIYVIGYYGENNGTLDQPVFKNELGSTLYYWNEGKDYIFGAYADGKAGKFDDVAFDAAKSVLTFTDYTPSTKDLVAAVSDKVENVTAASQGAVSLSFKHMLAQVGFTFNTQVGQEYTLAISDIQIEKAIKTATGTYTKSGDAIDWQGTATDEGEASYTYAAIVDLANGTTNSNSEYNLVIPQAVSGIQVTFTASINGVGIDPAKTRKITVPLPTTPVSKWTAGYKYNYTTTINAEDITDELKPIQFTVEEIPTWEEGGNTDLDVPVIQP